VQTYTTTTYIVYTVQSASISFTFNAKNAGKHYKQNKQFHRINTSQYNNENDENNKNDYSHIFHEKYTLFKTLYLERKTWIFYKNKFVYTTILKL